MSVIERKLSIAAQRVANTSTPASRAKHKAPARINLPEGNHDAVLLASPYSKMVRDWNIFAAEYERLIFKTHAVDVFPLAKAVPVLAYAGIARAAFSMCSAANIAGGVFDAVEFGRACERIAREQMLRYRKAHKPVRAD